ncbi:hypothetical protein B484DRAFT_358996 [Ochromonadaceae sp. CCMP2298]|nr:hypothetical protein B484DRAFT_358996 [Ochromonadaceae sp. CCMP2298]
MPIAASYTWSEKKESIKVLVPLKGVSASKADILVSSATLKVNFAPYLLDIVLLKEIDSVKHKASVKDGVLHITLCKKESGLWGSLQAEGDKETLLAAKAESLQQQEKLNQEMNVQRSDRRLADEKHALRKQMKLEETERGRMDTVKHEEKTAAEEEVYETFRQMQMEESQRAPGKGILHRDPAPSASASASASAAKKHVAFGTPPPAPSSVDQLLGADDIDDGVVPPSPPQSDVGEGGGGDDDSAGDIDIDIDADEEVDEEVRSRSVQELVVEEEEEVRYVPPPRSGGLSTCADQKVDIRFTPRVFPTPMRESKAAEEEDWVAKNRRHLKNHGVLGKSNGANVTEEDPVWLKAKGDDFFRAGDMRSALNAYSAALDADPRMLACLANRSVCQLRCGAAHECRLDCSAALLQIESEGAQGGSKEANVARHGVVEVKLLMRRGTACCQLGAFTEALTDFHQALSKFQHLSGQQCSSVPGVSIESLGADIARLKIMVDAEGLKKQGDALFAENTAEAMKKYTAALALVPVHVGCLSNRAALRMALQDFEGCCEDCGLAVALLQSDAEGRMDTGKVLSIGGGEGVLQPGDLRPMLSTVLPPPGSAKRTQWTVKTLLRRGVALAQLQRLDESASDYARASALDPSNEAIRADLTKICSLRDQRATGSMNTGTVAQEIQ